MVDEGILKYMKSIVLYTALALLSFNLIAKSDACGNNAKARQLVKLIMEDPDQLRLNISCNVLLVKAATEKAKLMAERGLVQHNLGGSPNGRLRDVGYKLPPYYGSAFSNQVEAIAGGYSTAEEVWRGFKNSSVHADHLLGKLDFYQEQDEIGIAFLYDWNTPHVEYWVVYLSKGYEPNQLGKFKEDEVPNKGNLILQKVDSDVIPVELAANQK